MTIADSHASVAKHQSVCTAILEMKRKTAIDQVRATESARTTLKANDVVERLNSTGRDGLPLDRRRPCAYDSCDSPATGRRQLRNLALFRRVDAG